MNKIDKFQEEIEDKKTKYRKGCGYKYENVICGEEKRYCSNCYIRIRKYDIKLRTIKQIRKLLE